MMDLPALDDVNKIGCQQGEYDRVKDETGKSGHLLFQCL